MARLSALIAAIAALAVAPVQAASFSSASLSDFRITLFDLNRADGITPRIMFPEPYLGDNAETLVQDDGNSGNTGAGSARGAGPFEVTVAVARSSARAAVAGTGPTNVISLTASGSALGTPVPGGSSFYTAFADAPFFSDFTVTANTMVSFSALAKVEAITTIGQDGFGFEFANAAAGLIARGPGPGGGGSQFTQDQVQILAASDCGPTSCSGQRISDAGLVTVSFANLTGRNMMGVVDRGVVVGGFSSVVPEPETYAMMVAGLGLLGFMLRRRGRLPHA